MPSQSSWITIKHWCTVFTDKVTSDGKLVLLDLTERSQILKKGHTEHTWSTFQTFKETGKGKFLPRHQK